MANAADIIVNLVAKTGKFTTGMTRGSRAMRTFRRSASVTIRTVRTLGRALAGLGIAIGGVGFAALIKSGIDTGDTLAKTAKKLGLATEELAGLRLAAELTGVQTKQLDLGIQRMTRRISEAAVGAGEAQGAIKELGLDAQRLAQLSPEKQFQAIADAFENVNSQSDKVRLGFKLFDSEGVALINTLDVGSEKLKEFADEAERFGLAFDRTQLKNVQEAADAQTKLGRAFTGLSRQLGATFSPAIEAAANATANFVAGITASLPTWTAWAAAILGVERNLTNLTTAELRAEIELLRSRVGDLVDLRDEVAKPFEQAIGRGDILPVGVQTQIDDYNARIATLTERANEATTQMASLAVEADNVGQSLAAAAQFDLIELVDGTKLLEEAWKRINKTVEQHHKSLQAAGDSITSQMLTPAERYVEKMREARDLLAGGFIDEETFRRYQEFLEGQIIPAIDEVTKQTDQLGFTFSSAFEDAIVEGKKLRDVLEGIYKDILRIFIRKFISEPLGNALAGSVSGLFGGGSTRHIGGAVSAGVPYQTIPGEMFIPGEKGSIVPAKRAGGQSIVMNQYNDFRGVDEASVYARVLPALDQTKGAAVSEVRQLIREGRL